ncbi:response regulator [Massilia sp. CF038]|uniref:response regulator n=1 Tax=Massilia sp. CF038 TaxID=1881045 RepID=UPI00091DCB8E|nr:response regulator [Massilia sp. CF038]SHH55776.1 two-component system, chemotaxis family, response regulator CheY [Massilia sp. CF038]
MLKAVIVDSNAISRGLLNTVLTDGGYEVVAQAHTALLGFVQVQKHQPQIFCIAREQVEDGHNVVEQVRATYPKTLIFMMSGTMDATLMQTSLTRGVQGFIVKPFKADAVLNTIRKTVMDMIKRQKANS